MARKLLLTALCLLGHATTAAALVQPAPFPPPGTVCAFEGVFPGTEAVGRWEYRVTGPEAYEIGLSSPSLLEGVLRQRLGEPFSIVEVTLDGWERASGPLVQAHDKMRATLETGDGRILWLENTVRLEVACASLPRDIRVGERWSCRERVSDTWDMGPGEGEGARSGTETTRSVVEYQYVADEDMAHPATGAPVRAAVVELRDERGRHERMWVDPALPWCTLRVERLKLEKHVVGQFRLVGISTAPAPAPAPGSVGPAVFLPAWAFAVAALVLLGLLGLCARLVLRRRAQ